MIEDEKQRHSHITNVRRASFSTYTEQTNNMIEKIVLKSGDVSPPVPELDCLVGGFNEQNIMPYNFAAPDLNFEDASESSYYSKRDDLSKLGYIES